MAQIQAVSQRLVLPLPRGMAKAKRLPRRTASSIRAMAFRWSGDHGRWKVSGKYDLQKVSKLLRARFLRRGCAISGRSPMSRPEADRAAFRARADSFKAPGLGPVPRERARDVHHIRLRQEQRGVAHERETRVGRAGPAVAWFLDGLEEMLLFYDLPKRWWRWARTTSLAARLIRKLRRRLRPMGTFDNPAAADRAVFGQLLRWHLVPEITHNA